jgi:hypothetical protein
MEASANSLLLKHINARPLMQVEDVYKLIYQSCMGLGHLLKDRNQILWRLISEMDTNWPTMEPENLMEDITLNHPLIRVNLRPYVKEKLPPEILYAAMLETELFMQPDRNRLIRTWDAYLTMENQQILPGCRLGLEEFAQKVIEKDYPVQHHSEAYRQTYFPSYRIVDTNIFSQMLNAI